MALLSNYLRSHRRRLDLSQDEVAFLLGTIGKAKVSRYERSARFPGLKTVLALEVILQKPVRELYAGLYEMAQRDVEARAKRLLEQTADGPPGRQMSRKRQMLMSIINRGAQ